MSHLAMHSYAGFGTAMRKEYHYSQSVKIPSGGETVFIAGQGGWDPAADTMEIATGPDAERIQIEQALKNVELALNEAGAEMKHVFKYTSYHNPITEHTGELFVAAIRRAWPDHQPVWTFIGVAALADPRMLVEIDVVAHVPEEKKD